MTGGLELATLQVLRDVGNPGPNDQIVVKPEGKPAPVQFNPATLRIAQGSHLDQGGQAATEQRRTISSQRHATLSFDLEFDTAEDGTTAAPVDVRTKVDIVRQFIRPVDQTPPPRVRFQWGNLIFDGMVTQLTEEIDYFDANGTALRAKASVTIVEQNLKLESKQIGPGKRTAESATVAGGISLSGPGFQGTANASLVVSAQAGESTQQLLSRLDRDPAEWRSAMNGLTSPLSLSAGTQVELPVATSGGFGASAGFAAGTQAGGTAELSAALGLDAPAGSSLSAGFALSANGGVAASAEKVRMEQAFGAQARARADFGAPAAAGRPDARASTYGQSIPLRPRTEPR